MPPVTQLDTPGSSPKSPARKRPKFSLTLKKPKSENGESSAEKFYPIFSSPLLQETDCSSSAEPLALPLPHVGLVNHRNICYANAVLQVLRHGPGFADYVGGVCRRLECSERLREVGSTKVEEGQNLLLLLSNLDKLLHLMKIAETEYGSTKEMSEYLINRKDRIVLAVDPLDFMDCFRELNPMFQSHLQHDSQEFLCTLLVNIQDALTKMGNGAKTEDANSMMTLLEQKSATGKGTCEQNLGVDKLDFIKEMFQGQLVIQTKCLTCEGVRKRFEDFQDVSVPVEKEHPVIDPLKMHHFSPAPKADKVADKPTLNRALSQFATVDYLYGDNKYFCETCCAHAEAQITTCFDVLPEVFTVHFKRFKADSHFGFTSGWVNKITSNLETPSHLSLKQWCSQTCTAQDSTYELFGIVVHSGTSSCSGHYTAYVKVAREDCTANHTDGTQGNGGPLPAARPDNSSPGVSKDGHISCSQDIDFPKAVSASQSDEHHKDGDGSLESPQNPPESPKSQGSPKHGITKYFPRLSKNTPKLTTGGQFPKDNDHSTDGGHRKKNAENGDHMGVQSCEHQTPNGKSSVNRKLQYETGRGKNLIKATGSSTCDSEGSDNHKTSIQDDEISSSDSGDRSNLDHAKWLHFDDADVYTLQESDLSSVLSSSDSSFSCPYLLFYKRATSS